MNGRLGHRRQMRPPIFWGRRRQHARRPDHIAIHVPKTDPMRRDLCDLDPLCRGEPPRSRLIIQTTHRAWQELGAADFESVRGEGRCRGRGPREPEMTSYSPKGLDGQSPFMVPSEHPPRSRAPSRSDIRRLLLRLGFMYAPPGQTHFLSLPQRGCCRT